MCSEGASVTVKYGTVPYTINGAEMGTKMDGILNVYKEKGYTSHDVVAKLRGILKQKKIGHTGTLDPEAQGVLPVCLGNATKVCDILTDQDKVYSTVLLLGKETDTQDCTGQVQREQEVTVSEEEVRTCIASFVGAYSQVPPMYSALKVNGKKLYELAREGKTVERQARTVQIYEICITKICLPRIFMTVSCSKGTYIRTLCHDIGQKLGCGGCMESLLRQKVSVFTLDHAKTLAQIEAMKKEGALLDFVIPVPDLFPEYPRVQTKPEYSFLVHNGNPVTGEQLMECPKDSKSPVLLYDDREQFIGIFVWKPEKRRYFPEKMFYTAQN